MPDDQQTRSLVQDLQDIWKAAGLLALALTFLALGVSGVLAAVFDPAIEVSHVIFGTWPFVISATLLFLMIMDGSLNRMSAIVAVVSIFSLFAIPYIIANVAGAADWHGRTWESNQWGPAVVLEWFGQELFSILSYYYRTYGPVLTGQALVCALFLAWALQYKLLPHAHRILSASSGASADQP